MDAIVLNLLDTHAPEGLGKAGARAEMDRIRQELQDLQYRLYAEKKQSVLLVLQGMDASGKDSLIRDVFETLSPQGVRVQSFQKPTQAEQAHDFLWRVHRHAPPHGYIHVFNRSHYEDVLEGVIHGHMDPEQAISRLDAIKGFERLLRIHGHTRIIKCYLHVSARKQMKRLEERLTKARKMWKHDLADIPNTRLRPQYEACYEQIFRHCDDPPWHIIPADQNWYKALLVARLLRDTLLDMNPQFPPLAAD